MSEGTTDHGEKNRTPPSSPFFQEGREKDLCDEELTREKVRKSEADLISPSKQEIVDRLFKNAVVLAPMVRASSTPLRTLCLRYGADLVYTEEMIDRSILKCDRIENKTLGTVDYVRRSSFLSLKQQKRQKDCNTAVIIRKAPEEKGKFVYQMGTGNAAYALESALYVEKDIDVLDINMGCPKKFSVGGGKHFVAKFIVHYF